jgi:hypothetical protein
VIDLAVTATHEAGHVVMAHMLGVGVRRVALLPAGGGVTELDALDPADPSSARRALILLAAGDAAEAVCGPARRTAGYWSL